VFKAILPGLRWILGCLLSIWPAAYVGNSVVTNLMLFIESRGILVLSTLLLC